MNELDTRLELIWEIKAEVQNLKIELAVKDALLKKLSQNPAALQSVTEELNGRKLLLEG